MFVQFYGEPTPEQMKDLVDEYESDMMAFEQIQEENQELALPVEEAMKDGSLAFCSGCGLTGDSHSFSVTATGVLCNSCNVMSLIPVENYILI